MAILQLDVRSDIPAYQFRQNLDGTVYTLRFRWQSRMCVWIFDILNEQEEPLLVGMPVLTNSNINRRFLRAGVPPGFFVSADESGQNRNPDRETFGQEVKFFYVEAEQ